MSGAGHRGGEHRAARHRRAKPRLARRLLSARMLAPPVGLVVVAAVVAFGPWWGSGSNQQQATPGRGPLTASPAPAVTPSPPPSSTPSSGSAGTDIPAPVQTATRVLDPVPADAGKISRANSRTVVVNKRRPLDPVDYAPRDLVPVPGADRQLRAPAARALVRLLDDAAAAGEPFRVDSAYRSYDVQRATYQGWVRKLGRERADVQSARPGFSEHQTGLAADLLAASGPCRAFACFAKTPQARWLARHAHHYGFVVRYPRGARAATGYSYEPWHLRFVGKKTARRIRRAAHAVNGPVTLERYFGLPAAPTYRSEHDPEP